MVNYKIFTQDGTLKVSIDDGIICGQQIHKTERQDVGKHLGTVYPNCTPLEIGDENHVNLDGFGSWDFFQSLVI